MSRIMWIHVESQYRGQSDSGLIVIIDEEAMNKALKNAGNAVFDTEWWVETLPVVLDHWGIRSKRWVDPATQMPQVHYNLGTERTPTGTTGPLRRPGNTGPLKKATGPLTARLNSGKLNSSILDSGRLNSGKLREDK